MRFQSPAVDSSSPPSRVVCQPPDASGRRSRAFETSTSRSCAGATSRRAPRGDDARARPHSASRSVDILALWYMDARASPRASRARAPRSRGGTRASRATARRGLARGRRSTMASSSDSFGLSDDVSQKTLEMTLLRRIDGDDGDGKVLETLRELTSTFDASSLAIERIAEMSEGTWTLKFSTKSAFDATAPLGRRADGTAPGIEAVFAGLFPASDSVGERGDGASSSPIQRLVLDRLREGGFAVRQAVRLDGARGRVDQAVCFGGDFGWFRLSARASVNDGKASPSARGRIDYGFDLAYVDLKKPFEARLPYPVPFRLLGKEAEGYLTCDYVSDDVRVCTGNKGTTFVFVKEARDALPYAKEFYG